jgi:elongation factor P
VAHKTCQYLYKDADNANFMDMESYEQFSFTLESLGDLMGYLKDGENVVAVMYEEKPITIQIPPKVVLKVIETNPGVKGPNLEPSLQLWKRVSTCKCHCLWWKVI